MILLLLHLFFKSWTFFYSGSKKLGFIGDLNLKTGTLLSRFSR